MTFHVVFLTSMSPTVLWNKLRQRVYAAFCVPPLDC